MTKLTNILKEQKFESILHYLKIKGIDTINHVQEKHFEDMYFIPDVPEEVVLIAIQKIKDNQKQEETQNLEKSNSKIVNIDKHYLIKNKQNNNSIDLDYYNFPLTEIFNTSSTELLFLNYCDQLGINNLQELVGIDTNPFFSSVKIKKSQKKKFIKKITDCMNAINNRKNFEWFLLKLTFENSYKEEIFLNNCKKKGLVSLNKLLEVNFEQSEFEKIGQKILDDFNSKFEEILDNQNFSRYMEPIIIREIPKQNYKLDLNYLKQIDFKSNNIDILLNNNMLFVEDLINLQLSHKEYHRTYKYLDFLKNPISSYFVDYIKSLPKRSILCIEEKMNEKTLQEIGDSINVTRERVRQIIFKTHKNCEGLLKLISFHLLKTNYNKISIEIVIDFFNNEKIGKYFYFLLIQSEIQYYFKYSKVIINKALIKTNIDKTLTKIAMNIISEDKIFYDILEDIESALSEYNLNFLSIEDFKNFLIFKGYTFYKDIVTKGKISYSIICLNIIKKYFDFDVKLDQKDSMNDIKKIRYIATIKYPDIPLPDSDKSLSSRLKSYLILSGRGRYCPFVKVEINYSILNEIINYINNTNQASFYYSELFNLFKGSLISTTVIDNPNFLHGILLYYYPNNFKYERDLLTKKGENRIDLNLRLTKLLLDYNRPIAKKELKTLLPGISEAMIAFTIERVHEIIIWDYNKIIHTNILQISDLDIATLDIIISKAFVENKYYLSEKKLFSLIVDEYPGFLKKNQIHKSITLFYIITNLFQDKYRFRKPHIIAKNSSIREISYLNIFQYFNNNSSILNYNDFKIFCMKEQWGKNIIDQIFNDVIEKYIRVSKNKYILKSKFEITNEQIELIYNCLLEKIPKSNYIALFSITDYEFLPMIKYEWNGFLLQSIIEEYILQLKIVEPLAKYRKMQYGIILNSNMEIFSYDGLIYYLLTQEKMNNISEYNMIKFLKFKGVLKYDSIPNELFNSKYIKFKNSTFVLSKL